MKGEFKPQKCHAPRHGNVCQYMSATLCTACNLYTADAQIEVQFVTSTHIKYINSKVFSWCHCSISWCLTLATVPHLTLGKEPI